VRRCEELRLLEGLYHLKVEVAPQMAEPPRRHVVRVHCQLRRVVRAEGEAEAAVTELGVERAIGARPDAAATWRYPGVEEKRRAEKKNGVWQVEKKKWRA
jgi:hypothetical protein